MDKESVKALLAKEGIAPGHIGEGSDYIQVAHERPEPDTTYWFTRGKLLSVIYLPYVSTLYDTRDVEALVALLTSKFGSPVHTNDADAADVRLGDRWPADFFDWCDGETAVRLVAKVEREGTRVRYTSVALQSEKDAEEARVQAEKERNALQQSRFNGKL